MPDLPALSMICADTTRSRAYLQNLARADLRPAHVLAMLRPGSDLPGQSRAALPGAPAHAGDDPLWQAGHFDPNTALADDLDSLGAPVTWLDQTDINAPAVVAALAGLPGDVALFSGFGGQILRGPVLGAGKRILHVHGGYLPDFRGSTTNYYSLIAEDTLGASAIFMTAEIDAGPILMRRKFDAPPDRTQIDHLHDATARARVLVDTLEHWRTTGDWPRATPGAGETAQTYYVIHPVLKHLAVYS
jgi:methionyl-tRNA formyltransferase